MSQLTVAAKANGAFLLPTLLAINFVKQSLPGTVINVEFEDVESIGSQGAKLELKSDDGKAIYDDDVLKHLENIYVPLQAGDKEKVDEWVKRSTALRPLDFKSLDQPMKELDSHLTLRSYIVGYALTLADLAVWGTLRGNRIAISAIRKAATNTSRWFSFIEASYPWVNIAVAELSASAQKRKAAASAAGASYNIGLQNVENGVVTRFPPEPSGYLHIGHAKAALLNDYFAHEQNKGTLICRFDDTNPSKENQEFEDAIKHDLSLLGIYPDKTSFSSDYFQEMYEYCIQIIKAGKAYADDTAKEVMQEERFNGIESKRRNESIEDNLARFAEMKTGSEEGQRWCIRAKISIDDLNKALRDPVIYRCNLEPHHRTGTTWKIYPTYDFCVPILDSLEGVTHALRTTEYGDRNAQYVWMQEALGIRKVHIWDFSRVNFIRAVLSKRKLTKLVEEGVVWGWDDPRMPTIRGIRRRGMTVPALREFILKQGPSRNVVNLDWTLFWATNRKYIDPVAPRHTAIEKQDVVRVTVKGIEGVQTADKPKHIKNPELGTKKVIYSSKILLEQVDAATFQKDEEITLMNWGNTFVRKITSDPMSDGKISSLELELHLAGDVKKTDKKVTWLAEEGQELVPVELVDFDYIISKDKIEKDEDIHDFLTSKTEFRSEAFADCNVAGLAEGDIIQFERKGYFRLDRPYKEGKPAVFFNIPTGKTG
ncbi:glutamyl-tRNA synthetase [Paracoccidioides lutzii Pb01]|uniref:glutamate--tRNA ligase n=1 Tax=Paracoccidioides lutzii (strain ATCC MYA-826 / Pb01) TaxID=502779 RepID=C1GU76_PARBA|nr:glutamyl-tRNA synthetase [Paracoccidioides lutzii Pb01]EEH39882.1 glutamyl-tRNA synthetase [Paracoccidioides lutzii Pb01]